MLKQVQVAETLRMQKEVDFDALIPQIDKKPLPESCRKLKPGIDSLPSPLKAYSRYGFSVLMKASTSSFCSVLR
jgi:hypothetical protein